MATRSLLWPPSPVVAAAIPLAQLGFPAGVCHAPEWEGGSVHTAPAPLPEPPARYAREEG